ncbi:hypothetical protein PInf_019845 [Phytophthora infestans]|nr:hypothetical protein PInf_019845 [Phytophthora infestans]
MAACFRASVGGGVCEATSVVRNGGSIDEFLSKKEGDVSVEFVQLMEVISKGGFLMECPEDVTLKRETKWLKEQGHYSLQALFMNEILNIWAFWKQYKKDVSVKIPMQGIASKFYFVREWEAAR